QVGGPRAKATTRPLSGGPAPSTPPGPVTETVRAPLGRELGPEPDDLAARVVVDVREPLRHRQRAEVVVRHDGGGVGAGPGHLPGQRDALLTGTGERLLQVLERGALRQAVGVVRLELGGRVPPSPYPRQAPALDAHPVVDGLAVRGRVARGEDAWQ